MSELEQYDKHGFLIKTPAQHFADWEGYAFGFGYGTGDKLCDAARSAFRDGESSVPGDRAVAPEAFRTTVDGTFQEVKDVIYLSGPTQ